MAADQTTVLIDDERIAAAIRENAEDAVRVREVLEKAKELKGLNDQEAACLMNVQSPELAEQLFHTARQVKNEIYGRRLVLFAPLYVSNLCANDCTYCAFRAGNPEVKADKESATLGSCFSLLSNRFVLLMVLGIFVYVGIEICLSSGVPILLSSHYGIDLKTWGLLGNAFFFIAILTGRFLGSVILSWVKPHSFFRMTVALSVLGLLLIFVDNQVVTLAGVFITGLGFANIFPLIFSITVDSMPERANEISGLMVTAIAGGAFIPPLMGLLADATSVRFGFIVPLAGIAFIALLTMVKPKTQS